MMRILVAQMTRMGDMIQTTPLVRVLRRAHPDAHITALVRKMSRVLCDRNPDIDEVMVYDEDPMYQNLCAQDSDRLLRAYENAEEIVGALREGRYDICYNCTHSIASAMLFKLAEVPKVVGAHLSDDWQFVLRGRWVTYFFTSVLHRQYNALNLCDISRHFARGAADKPELVFGISDEDRAFVSALFAEHHIGADDFVVCFQLGASEDRKRWTEQRFAELAKRLVDEKQARVLLLGVQSEAALGEAFERYAPGVAIPLFGRTTIPQVGALLERARLLVSNDTGTMHIAAAVRCPVVLVSIGHVHFRETGPYGAGHCAIERRRETLGPASWTPGGPDAFSQVEPGQVLRAIELVLSVETGDVAAELDQGADLTDVDIYLSEFAPDGCLDWYPALRRPLTETDYVRIAYRVMWLEFLRDERGGQVERAGLVKMLGCFEVDGESLEEWRVVLEPWFASLGALAQEGAAATETLLTSLRAGEPLSTARELVQELTRLDEEIRLYGEVHEACRPLVLISRYERENLEGADPEQLAETTLQIYRDLLSRTRLMIEKLQMVAEAGRSLDRPPARDTRGPVKSK